MSAPGEKGPSESGPTDLGTLLLALHAVDAATLAAARAEALRRRCGLVAELVDRRGVSEEIVAIALERVVGGRIGIDIEPVDLDAVREVSHDTADRYRLVPLALQEQGGRRLLRVAMADPLDLRAIDELESATGVLVEPLLSTSSEVRRAIERHYRGLVTKVVHRIPPTAAGRPTPGSPPSSGLRTTVPTPRPRALFGIAAHERPSSPADDREGTPLPQGLGSRVRTQPIHQLDREATLEQRLRAMLEALYASGVLTPEDYASSLREILKRDRGHS